MLEPNSLLQKRYRIIKPLAQGGMGMIYEAIDQRVKSTVVIKRTLFDHPELLQAFKSEARLLANLRHPALPKVMDHFVENSGQYLVMEHIPGQDLSQMLKALNRPFAPVEVLRWADALLRVLEYLHKHQPPILHRDIKPANLKLTESGEIYLLDFGLAKGMVGEVSTVQSLRSIPGYTPSYAPLEQILRSESQQPDRHWVEVLSQIKEGEVKAMLAASTDERCDIYSLGATLYHLLTNEQPTHSGRRAMFVWNGGEDPVRPASELNPLVPAEVSGIIASAMELQPERRPPSAAAMRTALRDAGQSLRLHTGQSALRQLSPEALDSLARRVAEEVSRAHAAELADLRAKLDGVSALLEETRAAAHRSEEGLAAFAAKSEALSKTTGEAAARIEQLRGEVVNKYRELDLKIADDRTRAAAMIQSLKTQLDAAVAQLDGRADKLAAGGEQTPPDPSRPTEGMEASSQGEPPLDPERLAELTEEERRRHAEAHRLAHQLVSWIQLWNEPKVREGREAGDLYQRLRDHIDRARKTYNTRTPAEVAARYDYFHHELVKRLAEGDPARMGDGYPGERLKR